jgi:hypothetical protein
MASMLLSFARERLRLLGFDVLLFGSCGVGGPRFGSVFRPVCGPDPKSFQLRLESLLDSLGIGAGQLVLIIEVLVGPLILAESSLALRGDYSKARKRLGWKPQITFEVLVEVMVRSDFDRLSSSANRPST